MTMHHAEPVHAADTSECPSCATTMFAVPAPGPIGYRWSHEPDQMTICPNDNATTD